MALLDLSVSPSLFNTMLTLHTLIYISVVQSLRDTYNESSFEQLMDQALVDGTQGFSLKTVMLTSDRVRQAHLKLFTVWVWTINTPKDLQQSESKKTFLHTVRHLGSCARKEFTV